MSTTTMNPLYKPGIIRAPFAHTPADGHELVDFNELNMFQAIMGSEGERLGGYHTEGDLVTITADGRDLNALWAEFQATLDIFNQHRSQLVSLLTYPVQQLIENVPQVTDAEFEEASEFGEPRGARVALNYFQMAYDFRDYDIATRYTWKFLRDADARQIEAVHQSILDADSRLVFRKVMEAIFDDRDRQTDIRGQNYKVYPLYNGDGTVPPQYGNTTFQDTHSHYMVSDSSQVDPADLEDMQENISEHGYGPEQGTTFACMMNRAQAKVVRGFRAGEVPNGADSGTAPANYDFIPAPGQPTLIVPNQEGLVGSQPPNSFNGLPVFGSYGGILLIEETFMPEGYMLMFGTGGAANLQNPVGLREHANPSYRGLRLLPGNQQRYPLVDSYYSRGFGTGIRQRAGAAVMQVAGDGTAGSGGSYVVPSQYKRGGGLS